MHHANTLAGLIAVPFIALVGIVYLWIVSRLIGRPSVRPVQRSSQERRAA